MKTAVITMVQVKDFPAAWSSLGCVDGQLAGLDRARCERAQQPAVRSDFDCQLAARVTRVIINAQLERSRIFRADQTRLFG